MNAGLQCVIRSTTAMMRRCFLLALPITIVSAHASAAESCPQPYTQDDLSEALQGFEDQYESLAGPPGFSALINQGEEVSLTARCQAERLTPTLAGDVHYVRFLTAFVARLQASSGTEALIQADAQLRASAFALARIGPDQGLARRSPPPQSIPVTEALDAARLASPQPGGSLPDQPDGCRWWIDGAPATARPDERGDALVQLVCATRTYTALLSSPGAASTERTLELLVREASPPPPPPEHGEALNLATLPKPNPVPKVMLGSSAILLAGLATARITNVRYVNGGGQENTLEILNIAAPVAGGMIFASSTVWAIVRSSSSDVKSSHSTQP